MGSHGSVPFDASSSPVRPGGHYSSPASVATLAMRAGVRGSMAA